MSQISVRKPSSCFSVKYILYSPYVTNISTKKEKKSKNTRLSRPNSNGRWSECLKKTKAKRTRKTCGIVCVGSTLP